jgi:hypothetical protein
MNKYFLSNDIARCSNENCTKNLKCARYLDTLPFEQYWYSDFTEDMDCFIEKKDECENRKRNRQTLQSR